MKILEKEGTIIDNVDAIQFNKHILIYDGVIKGALRELNISYKEGKSRIDIEPGHLLIYGFNVIIDEMIMLAITPLSVETNYSLIAVLEVNSDNSPNFYFKTQPSSVSLVNTMSYEDYGYLEGTYEVLIATFTLGSTVTNLTPKFKVLDGRDIELYNRVTTLENIVVDLKKVIKHHIYFTLNSNDELSGNYYFEIVNHSNSRIDLDSLLTYTFYPKSFSAKTGATEGTIIVSIINLTFNSISGFLEIVYSYLNNGRIVYSSGIYPKSSITNYTDEILQIS